MTSPFQSKNILVGSKFGFWEVISETLIRKNNQVYRECKCKCGTIKSIPNSALINGRSTRCHSCAQKNRLKTLQAGEVHKSWVCTGNSKKDKYNTLWEVKCLYCNDNTSWLTYTTITRKDGSFKCRKCAKKDALQTFLEGKGRVGELNQGKFSKAQRCAKARNIEFSVSKQYLWELYLTQNKECALTGDTLEDINKASLDRIDSNLPYIEGNVQWVTKQANLSKHTMNTEDLLIFCKKVINKIEG